MVDTAAAANKPSLFVRQLFEGESFTYTYLVADTVSSQSPITAHHHITLASHLLMLFITLLLIVGVASVAVDDNCLFMFMFVAEECLLVDPVLETVDR